MVDHHHSCHFFFFSFTKLTVDHFLFQFQKTNGRPSPFPSFLLHAFLLCSVLWGWFSNQINVPTCAGVHQVTMAAPPSLAACVASVTVAATSTPWCLGHVTVWRGPATSAPTIRRGSTARGADRATSALLAMATVGVSASLLSQMWYLTKMLKEKIYIKRQQMCMQGTYFVFLYLCLHYLIVTCKEAG